MFLTYNDYANGHIQSHFIKEANLLNVKDEHETPKF